MDQQQTPVPGEQTPEEALRDARAGLDDISSVLRQALAADDALVAKHAEHAKHGRAAGGDGSVDGR
ncbi:MAG: hypothetical protein QOH03_2460 [Kribbellaceae bacterium]|nr:hypothetical protein [Kribbellaceae bacterium]